ncbi:MAG: hypothetical protein J5I62_01005 [Flavobacteriales bacterium]|nr:hypothetical protein [Flavobacteriales bacterium]MEB2342326.1 hypothetical protein [Flavobacteriia bacterium]
MDRAIANGVMNMANKYHESLVLHLSIRLNRCFVPVDPDIAAVITMAEIEGPNSASQIISEGMEMSNSPIFEAVYGIHPAHDIKRETMKNESIGYLLAINTIIYGDEM